ncbi:peptidoglycan editing factor PgeF [Pseudoalteromonas sp.]|uniref:peptidoglycan editing factor PgeF n=1 Tax=Pseudoalteromonas sp. TaxID=53249 RepID=UPI00356A0801
MKTLAVNWQAPAKVFAFSTTRNGGVSKTPFNSLNLAFHVEDKPEDVIENRARLTKLLPAPAYWLSQVHSNKVVVVDATSEIDLLIEADALYTRQTNTPLAIMTADCLPVFICSEFGDEVAVLHAGWRGLLNGVIENTLACFKATNLMVHLGAAIGPTAFEVGREVRDAFSNKHTEANSCFEPVANQPNKFLADIYQLARLVLAKNNVTKVSGGEYCTVNQEDLFFSYRRDGKTGRNAHVIYIEQ